MLERSIGRNAAWLMTATLLTKLIAFVSFTIVARLAGVNITGAYFFSIAITSLFVILTDLGMTPVIIRALSAGRSDAFRLLGSALRIKCVLIPVAILAALAYGWWRQVAPETFLAIAVACAVMSADAVHLVFYGVLRGAQNLRFEAIGMFIGQLFTAIAALLIAFFRPSAAGLASALLIGSVWNVLWAAYQSRARKIIPEPPTRHDLSRLLREAAPFGIAGIAVKIYSYVDSLLIEKFHGLTSVGLYAVAYKTTYAFQFLPLTFTAALYPALAKQWADQDQKKLRESFLSSLRLLATMGFPLSAGLSALAPQIISLVYGKNYLAAIPAFQILPWVLLPIFLDFPIGALLNATHRAHLKTTAMVLTMIVNLLLNAALVPPLGPQGAAVAGVISFWLLLGIGSGFVFRDAGGIRVLCGIFARATLAAFLSWVFWHDLGDRLPLAGAVILGTLFALFLAFALRLFSRQDILRIIGRLRPSQIEETVHADT